jgi:putative transposase
MLLAHKIELRPTPDQVDYFEKACGLRRHCFNHLLAWFSQKDSDGNLIFKWSKKEAYQFFMKVLRVEFSWYSEVSSVITRNVIEDLDNAFKHFFRRVKNGEKPGYPQPKKKGVNESFAIRDVAKFDVKNKMLRIEKLKTRIDLRQPVRFEGKQKQVTISKRAGKYFASILIDTDEYNPNDVDRQESVGVDFGIKSLAILSNGEVFENEKLLRNSLRKLRKLQRSLSRKVKGSNGYAKAKLKIQKLQTRKTLYFQIARQRAAIAHQLSNYLTKTFDRIVIEDLHVNDMIKNRKLSRAIADVGWGMLRQFIEYKAKLRNCVVVIADRFFPSSKTCSNCGEVKKNLTLGDRVYECDSCEFTIVRDLNAAINLNNYAV